MSKNPNSYQLDWYELIVLSKAIKNYLKYLRRNIISNENKGWKPEEGKSDMNKIQMSTALHASDKIQHQLKILGAKRRKVEDRYA